VKIVALSVVRNEVDILEAFVRYHLEVVDHMVIVDHRGTDGSSELLRELEAEGLPLTIRPLTPRHVDRRRTATELMWATAEAIEPDLVLLLDADEFVASEAKPVRGALESLTLTAPTAIPWRTYVPTPDDDLSDPNPLTRIVHRRAFEPRRRYKVAVPGRLARDREYGLSNGSQRLVLWGSRAEVAAVTVPGLFLAHYPVRTVEQLSAKVVAAWAGQVATVDRPPDPDLDTRKVVAGLARKGDPGPEWLRDVALSHGAGDGVDEAPGLVRDPLELAPAQRYRVRAGASTLGILADSIEEVAEVMKAERGTSAERTVATVVERIDALEGRLGRLEGETPPPAAVQDGERPTDGPPPRRSKRVRRDTLARAQRRVRALEGELEELRESKSWKLTAPLRRLGSLGRSSSGR
jgi:hypothetical protein